MGGRKKKVTVGYRYGLAVHMGVCYGPVDRVEKILADDRDAYSSPIDSSREVYIYQPNLFGGDEKEGGLDGKMQVQMGEPSQQPSYILKWNLGNDIPAFRGILGFVYSGIMSANNPYLKPFSFIVKRALKGWKNGPWHPSKAIINHRDMNPAHIIYQCLTDTDWGMGYPSSAIDDANFKTVADQLYSEDFGLSLIWNQQNNIEAFLAIIFDHIAGSLVVDPKTGKYQIRLIRQDYQVDDLPIFDASNISVMESYQRAGWGELINEITLKYTDPSTFEETAVTVQNLAAIQIQGGVVNQTVSFTGINNATLAQRVAMRELIARSSPLAKVQFKVNRKAWKLLPNAIFKLSWAQYGIAELVMRVVNIGLGTLDNGLITIDAVEDVFGLPTNTYTNQQGNEWQDPLQPPAPSPYRKLTEVTHYDLVTTLSPADLSYIDPDDGFPIMFASSPSVGAYDYKLLINNNEVDQGGHCTVGIITTALVKEEYSIFIIIVDDVSQITIGEYAVINQEYVRIDAFDSTTNTLTVARGVIDTVPHAHDINSLIFFGDGASASDPSASPIGAVLQAKVITRTGMGELDPSVAPIDIVTIQARHNKPFPPAKFRINGDYLPEIVEGELIISWNERNRLLQDSNIFDQTEISIIPELDTTYTLKIYDQNDNLCRTLTGLLGTSYTYLLSDELSDCGGTQTHLKIELCSVRNGIESWQAHEHRFERLYAEDGLD